MSTAALPRRALREPLTLGLAGSIIAGALMMGWLALAVNRQAACINGEGFLLKLCEHAGQGTADALRARIARNPGDTAAYRMLALQDPTSDHNRLVEVALKLAPGQPQLLVHKAAAALDRNDVKAAIEPLVTVVDNHEIRIAARALAQIVAGGQGHLLEPYLRPGSRWLPRVLAEMRSMQTSISPALPLVASALKSGVIDSATVRKYIRELRTAKAWGDAYGLWLALLGKPIKALYNGDFDEPFDPDGFDWELPMTGPPARAGVIVDRRGAQGRSAVLDLQFTGRPIAMPIVRQQLFVGSGRYVLRGDHSGRQFRMETGLVWAIKCGARDVAHSPPFADTGGGWRPFEFRFEVPANCGLVATLQLATATPPEAILGARGKMAFDRLTLEQVSP